MTDYDETLYKFWSQVKIRSGCWEWSGSVMPKRPYGRCTWYGKTVPAHRVSYLLLKGTIPEGLEIDHLCNNPRCVNPDHLEAVTPQVNTRRSNNPSAINARKTHCIHGHELAGGNLYLTPKGNRKCRTCTRNRIREYMARARSEAKEAGIPLKKYWAYKKTAQAAVDSALPMEMTA